MKKLLQLFGLTMMLATLATPLSASALDRVAAVFTDGDAYMKEGGVGAGWRQLTSGVNIGSMSLVGDRVALLDAGTSAKVISMKEPAWNSEWNWTYFTDGGTPAASKMLVSQLSNGQYRLLVLLVDGSVVMKDGAWDTGWWSGTIEASGVDDIVIGGNRIGVIKSGVFKVKQLTPGQFSHPNNVEWATEASSVASAAMSNTWIAYRDTSKKVYAKEGATTAQWFGNQAIIFTDASKLVVSGTRMCIKTNSTAAVHCKEGSLGAGVVATYNNATDVKVTPTRFVVLSGGAMLINEGTLTNNSGWQTVATSVSSIEVN